MTRAAAVAAALLLLGTVGSAAAQTRLHVVSGVLSDGSATGQWLALLDRRLGDSALAAVAGVKRLLSADELAWANLIRNRAALWERRIAAVAAPYSPAPPPDSVLIVLGNRGASDAFTHDARTIGFDLSALRTEYGDARIVENADRIDRLFRHEYAHLMQKAWLALNPWQPSTPLDAALLEIWLEGLGNYHSLSERWRAPSGHSDVAKQALARLEPRFIARLAALACAQPEEATALMADLSTGRFADKWGALTAALWIEAERGDPTDVLRAVVHAGPDGIRDLAARHLDPQLNAALKEAFAAERMCRSDPAPSLHAERDAEIARSRERMLIR